MRRFGLVAVLLLLGACGTDDERPDGAAGAGGLRVEVDHDEPLRVGPVQWRVSVHNDGDDDVVLTFPNGQRADVVLVQDGDELYRWSLERMFIQQIGEETVPAGGARTFELDDELEVEPGDYELTATVTAEADPPLSTTRRVSVAARQR